MPADSTLTTTVGSGSDDVAITLQRYFSRELLKTLEENVVLAQFGKRINLPAKMGTKTMRFHRYAEAAAANVSTLTEGTAPTSTHLAVENVDADLTQYGEVISITDVVLATELFNNTEQATKRAGQDGALKVDEVIRAELFSNDTDIPSGNNTFSGSTTSYGTSIKPINATDLLDAATSLKIQKAMPLGGNFVAVCAPQVCRDIMNDGDWLEAHKYANPESILRGEAGRIHGVRVVETTVPYQAATGDQYTYSSSGTVFGTAVLGADAFGIPNLASQSPFSPSIIITSGADKNDPLNQVTTIGFKIFLTAKNIQPKHLARIYSKTNYGS